MIVSYYQQSERIGLFFKQNLKSEKFQFTQRSFWNDLNHNFDMDFKGVDNIIVKNRDRKTIPVFWLHNLGYGGSLMGFMVINLASIITSMAEKTEKDDDNYNPNPPVATTKKSVVT